MAEPLGLSAMTLGNKTKWDRRDLLAQVLVRGKMQTAFLPKRFGILNYTRFISLKKYAYYPTVKISASQG